MQVDNLTDKEIPSDNVQVFPSTDERLKHLGEILSNESSQNILSLLLEKELTIMEIAKTSGISANLVIHHLKKMVDSGIVKVVHESKNSRGHPLRFYRAKSAIVILTKEAAARADKSKSLRSVLGRITRFGVIGIAGTFTWIVTSSNYALESAFKYPRPTLPPYMTPIEPQTSSEFLIPVMITAGIVIAGVLLNRYLPKLIRK